VDLDPPQAVPRCTPDIPSGSVPPSSVNAVSMGLAWK
jgi:hypothetical protein